MYGLDLSTSMIVIAWDRLQDLKIARNKDIKVKYLISEIHLFYFLYQLFKKVRFEIGDATKHNYPADFFDYIYSRDVFLHIKDKEKLAAKLKVCFRR